VFDRLGVQVARNNRREIRAFARAAAAIADTMFALSTPSRVEILGCLLERPHTVTELTEALSMEQSAVSHQLRVLREHGLVAVERQGRTRLYAIADEHIVAFLDEAFRHVERREHRTRHNGPADNVTRASGRRSS
jgi:DNA-binding transcriptional ArsR family regulator